MEPTLRSGDRLLVDRGAYRDRSPRVGDVVAAEDPQDPARWLVKRVAGIGPGEVAVPVAGSEDPVEWPRLSLGSGTVYLLSDALDVGRDSRRFGPVPKASLKGQIWYRYAPRANRGPIDAGESGRLRRGRAAGPSVNL
jgi:signal peptidase I